ncbi:hypothetical protein C8J56DRAFT_556812 [Mycena floridula]|nr:hypothetical protein C8J56DRAFT_556812 [Mycena floridula]
MGPVAHKNAARGSSYTIDIGRPKTIDHRTPPRLICLLLRHTTSGSEMPDLPTKTLFSPVQSAGRFASFFRTPFHVPSTAEAKSGLVRMRYVIDASGWVLPWASGIVCSFISFQIRTISARHGPLCACTKNQFAPELPVPILELRLGLGTRTDPPVLPICMSHRFSRLTTFLCQAEAQRRLRVSCNHVGLGWLSEDEFHCFTGSRGHPFWQRW